MSTTKSGSVLFTQDINETQLDNIKKAKQSFIDSERRRLTQMVQDLEMTLEINKGIICDLLQCKTPAKAEGAVMSKLNDENCLLRTRLKDITRERDGAEARVLLQEQINCQQRIKDQEAASTYEEALNDLKDKLERKEYFMQNKEKKWFEVEKILEEYIEEDSELREKLYELRINVESNKRITNVVEENENLKLELDEAHEEISRLRRQLLAIGFSEPMQMPGRLSARSKSGDRDTIEAKPGREKKEFLSTAPINFKSGFNLGKPKYKETKADLKHYSHQLEEALAKTRVKYIEIEKDNEILNKTYLKELKKGDRMNQALQRVKHAISSLCRDNQTKMCSTCQVLPEIESLKRLIQERIFDVSNDGELTMEQLNISFKKQEPKRIKSQIISRGQAAQAISRTRQQDSSSIDKSILPRFSNIIAEEELNVPNNYNRSPMMGGMGGPKISAIGILDDQFNRKDSPFWDHENMFEIQQALERDPFQKQQQFTSHFTSDDFQR